MKEISAGGVVYKKEDGELLVQMIRDRFGKMTVAKGKQEAGETIEQCALREIEEETGIRGRIVAPIDVVTYQYEHPTHGTVDKEVHYYIVEAEAGELAAQVEEIDGVEWHTAEDALQLQLTEGYDNNNGIVLKALLHLGFGLAGMIDHTILKPNATRADIAKLCEEAKEYGFSSVCVNGVHVAQCAELLEDSEVSVCAVVGFPLGAMSSAAKAYETADAIANGATEIDMVLNVGALLEGNLALVQEDIAYVVDNAGDRALVKVIFETGYLTEEQIAQACACAVEAGAAFVKTSTGFGPGGATVEHIRLMRASVPAEVGVKASGGVRDTATAIAMVEAGADRIGTSSGIAIVTGGQATGTY
jgi:deoxyribose-phosphate aldolase